MVYTDDNPPYGSAWCANGGGVWKIRVLVYCYHSTNGVRYTAYGPWVLAMTGVSTARCTAGDIYRFSGFETQPL